MTTLLAGTGDGLWASDGTRTLEGHRVVDIDHGWVLVDGDALWSGGECRVRLPGSPATCLVAGPEGTVLVGTREAHMLRVSGETVERLVSFDAVEGRDGWYTPWGAPPDVRSLAAATDGGVYANVHVGGILRTDDGGATWVPTIDVDADVHQVLAADDDVLAATAYGLARSPDRGRTWSFSTEGLHAAYSRAVAAAGDWLLVSASTGPRTDRAAVYRRPVDAADDVAFERCGDGLPAWFAGNIDTGSLVADGSVAALATADGTVYRSDDSGASWRRVATDLGRVRRLALVD